VPVRILIVFWAALAVSSSWLLLVDANAVDISEAERTRALREYTRKHKTPKTPTLNKHNKKTRKKEAKPIAHIPIVEPPKMPSKPLAQRMDDANHLYDARLYEESREAAFVILREDEDNVRMKRIVVSSSCILGERDIAEPSYNTLPARDQRQMARRCKPYGIDFEMPN